MLKNHKNWGGYMIFVGKSTYYMTLSGVGVVGPLKFSKIPLTDHGVQLKSPWTPPLGLHYKTLIASFVTESCTKQQ